MWSAHSAEGLLICLVLFPVSHLVFFLPIWFPAGPVIVWVLSSDCWLSIGWTSETVNRWVEKKNKLGHWSITFSTSVSSSGPDLIGLGAAWAWAVESPLDILVCDRIGELGKNLCWFLPYWVSTKNGIPCIWVSPELCSVATGLSLCDSTGFILFHFGQCSTQAWCFLMWPVQSGRSQASRELFLSSRTCLGWGRQLVGFWMQRFSWKGTSWWSALQYKIMIMFLFLEQLRFTDQAIKSPGSLWFSFPDLGEVRIISFQGGFAFMGCLVCHAESYRLL